MIKSAFVSYSRMTIVLIETALRVLTRSGSLLGVLDGDLDEGLEVVARNGEVDGLEGLLGCLDHRLQVAVLECLTDVTSVSVEKAARWQNNSRLHSRLKRS